MSDKYNKAVQVLADRWRVSPGRVIEGLDRMGISRVQLYIGLGRMGYSWVGEKWQRVFPLPHWYYRLKDNIGV